MVQFTGSTMAKLFILSLIFVQHFLSLHSQSTQSSRPLVPAMYVFGDCQVDGGVNADLIVSSRLYYYPYGIDFVIGATGRLSNGATIADFLAESLGLQVSIHYSPSKSSSNKLLTGYNYASGPSGILPETGTAFGTNWSMEKQVALFNLTVHHNLPKHFKTKAGLSDYLSKSLFLIATGTADYKYNYLQPQFYNSSKKYNPDQFSRLLVNRLGEQLQKLYKLGARKFLVFEVVPLGCYPAVLKLYKPKTRCAEEVNNMILLFNRKLEERIRKLRSTHQNMTITIARTNNLIRDFVENPLHGFLETKKPCCSVKDKGAGFCIPHNYPCEDRNTTLFWDEGHLTEAANKIITNRCFSGLGVCKPNLQTSLHSSQPHTRPCLVHLLILLTISGWFLFSQEYWILQYGTSVQSQL